MRWYVKFEENGGEYHGYLCITANKVVIDDENYKVCYADGIRIEIDEYITEISILAE